MARGRMIAKVLSTSEKFAALYEVAGKLAEFCQSLYPLLVAHADDFGRQQGDPFTVKHAVFPVSPRSITDFEKALGLLAKVGLIECYTADGKQVVQIHDFSEHQPGLTKRTRSKFPEPSGNSVKSAEIPLQEKGTEGNRTEENRREGNSALASVTTERDPAMPECKVEAVVQLWNTLIAGSSLPACKGLSDKRRKHIKARMVDHQLGVIRDVMTKARDSPFCNGMNDRRWVMTFDWLMESPDNFLKVMEGKYDDHKKPPRDPGPAYNPWTCRHLEECSNRAMCDHKNNMPHKYPVRNAEEAEAV